MRVDCKGRWLSPSGETTESNAARPGKSGRGEQEGRMQVALDKWQLIETAPRDKRALIVNASAARVRSLRGCSLRRGDLV